MKVVRTAFAVLAVALATACSSTPTAPVDQADYGQVGSGQDIAPETQRGQVGSGQ